MKKRKKKNQSNKFKKDEKGRGRTFSQQQSTKIRF